MSILQPRIKDTPVPNPSGVSIPYWEGTRVDELRYQRCSACDSANFGPGLICSNCQGRELTWEISAGAGSLYSWTVVWRPQTPAFEVPYAPAIVAIDEGYNMMSAIVGCEPDELGEGMRLQVEFHALTDEITLPFFSPS